METFLIILLCVILLSISATGVLIFLTLNNIRGYLDVLEVEIRQTKQELKKINNNHNKQQS